MKKYNIKYKDREFIVEATHDAAHFYDANDFESNDHYSWIDKLLRVPLKRPKYLFTIHRNLLNPEYSKSIVQSWVEAALTRKERIEELENGEIF